jgi:hypothetical protein
MAKIIFEDKSYVEVRKSPTESDKIVLIIHAKDQSNALKRVINAVEITTDEFKQLIADIQVS